MQQIPVLLVVLLVVVYATTASFGGCVSAASTCDWDFNNQCVDGNRSTVSGSGKDNYDNFGDFFTKSLRQFVPPLNLTIPGVSENCRKQGKFYMEELNKLTLWAFQMYDSTAKIPSGILNGNVNQFGDFDQCMDVHFEPEADNDVGTIDGKYCLANIQIDPPPPSNSKLSKYYQLINSHFPLRSNISDASHIAPRFSSIHWAVCVPSQCTPTDVELTLRTVLEPVTARLGVTAMFQVDHDACTTLKDQQWPIKSIIVAVIFTIFITYVVAVSIYDFFNPNPELTLTTSFSLVRNTRTLLATDRGHDDIACVHGIRFFNALLLLVAHKAFVMFYLPYTNRTVAGEKVSENSSFLGRAAALYTDPFIMLSGMLTAYSLFGRLYRKQPINLRNEYISRLIRIVPVLATMLAVWTFILPYTNSGPQWGTTILRQSTICESNWWRSLLFINNYFGFENICVTNTHHVGTDMQLFAISPLLVLVVWKWPRRGILTLLGLAAISTAVRFRTSYVSEVNLYVHYGTSLKQLFNTANSTYIIPFHRLTVYIMGLLLGYMFRTYKNINLKPVHLAMGHTLAFALFCASVIVPAPLARMDYEFNPIHGAIFTAFGPIAWTATFCWLTAVSYYGYDNFLTKFFSHRYFIITTRLSYALYLSQYPVFFYYIGILRSPEFYKFPSTNVNHNEFIIIFMVTTILTLFVDIPFQNVKSVIYKKPKPKDQNNGVLKQS